jgi:hypothetical protein
MSDEDACALISEPWPIDLDYCRAAANDDLADGFRRLRREHGLARISLSAAEPSRPSLVDAGLIQDLCLTTSARRRSAEYALLCRPSCHRRSS